MELNGYTVHPYKQTNDDVCSVQCTLERANQTGEKAADRFPGESHVSGSTPSTSTSVHCTVHKLTNGTESVA